jgi:hypothetical protein
LEILAARALNRGEKVAPDSEEGIMKEDQFEITDSECLPKESSPARIARSVLKVLKYLTSSRTTENTWLSSQFCQKV